MRDGVPWPVWHRAGPGGFYGCGVNAQGWFACVGQISGHGVQPVLRERHDDRQHIRWEVLVAACSLPPAFVQVGKQCDFQGSRYALRQACPHAVPLRETDARVLLQTLVPGT
jgi:hypothetical protein